MFPFTRKREIILLNLMYACCLNRFNSFLIVTNNVVVSKPRAVFFFQVICTITSVVAMAYIYRIYKMFSK